MDSPMIRLCPHCSNTAPQNIVYDHPYVEIGYSKSGEKEGNGPPCNYIIAICSTCNEILLYHSFMGDDLQLIFPKDANLDVSVPQDVRSCYSEAAKIKNLAPNAYAVMIRRALEALCDDRGVTEGPLAKRLSDLAAKGEIPPTLADITNMLRLLGNAGAHNNTQPVSIPMTWTIDDFFRVIIEYVYVAPKKLKEFKEKLEKLNKPFL